ncbi:HAMP domain-containing sensor histidine kinase [Brochothrix thermosphacta]|uniref:HAMP domain-containing sensor histidine kinase n=2 Tax=Brochothrix thermosphacta TaxID=2756 RepID=UPI0013C3FD9A|nr:ATP-binding protein [Brochothrix thermosphacta]
MTMIILTVCCLGLTVFTNMSAKRMSINIAESTIPAASINQHDNQAVEIPGITMTPSVDAVDNQVRAEQERLLKQYYISSVGYMLVIIILGGVAAYYFSGKGLTSLKELNKKMKNSSVATLSEELPVPPSNDEIAELTESFNKMKHQLNDSFIFQQQFSANVAHELRTPLTVLNTKLEVFKRKNPEMDETSEVLVTDLTKQVARLIDMGEKLLQLTNDYTSEEYSSIIASDLFESIASDLKDRLMDKEIQLTLPTESHVIEGDLDLLYQAFYNLLENSIKYNKQQGIISIVTTESADETVVNIKDTGCGIPKSQREDVFKTLYRVDEARNRDASVGGSGLGLAIVKKIIDKHQGQIKLLDNIDGTQGITVTVVLPKKKEA